MTGSLTGLTPNTTYYFRVVATNSAGTTNGAILSFATGTSGTAPGATTQDATSVTSSGATLNASVNPDGERHVGLIRLWDRPDPGIGHALNHRPVDRCRDERRGCHRAVVGTGSRYHILLPGGGDELGRHYHRLYPEFHDDLRPGTGPQRFPGARRERARSLSAINRGVVRPELGWHHHIATEVWLVGPRHPRRRRL